MELADAGDPGQRHLGVDGPGQREVACPGRAGRRPRTSAPARSRTCPGRRGCARAARGGRRASGRWPGRAGSARAAARRRPAAAPARPGVTAVNRPSVDLDQHVRRPTGAGRSQAYSAQYRRRSASPARQLLQHVGERRRPRPRSRRRWRARPGACETPVGLRTNSIAVGTCAGQHPGVVPGAGRQHRRAAQQRRPAGRAASASNATSAVDRLGGHARRAVPSRVGPLGGLRRDRRRPARPAWLVGGPGVQPGRSPAPAIALVALGSTATRPTVACAPRQPGLLVGGQHGVRRRSASGRAGRPSGWCRRGWPRR